MDTGVLITALLILFIAVSPFAAYSLVNKLRRSKLLRALNTQAESAGVTISEHEILNHLAIATNENRTWLFFAKRIGSRYDSYAINLTTVAACRVETITQSEPGPWGIFTIATQGIELQFTLNEGGNVPLSWEIYSAETEGPILRGEPEFAEKWNKTIQPYIGIKAKATARV